MQENLISVLESMGRRGLPTGQWWGTPLVPAVGRQRQENLCEFEASLGYSASYRTAKTADHLPVELQKIGSYPTKVLGIKVGSSARIVCTLNH